MAFVLVRLTFFFFCIKDLKISVLYVGIFNLWSVLFRVEVFFELKLLFPHRVRENHTPCFEFVCPVECVLIWPAIHLLQLLLQWKVILWSWFSFYFICVNVIPYELPWIFFLTAKKHNHFSFQEDWKKSSNSYLGDDLNCFPSSFVPSYISSEWDSGSV